MLLPRAHRQDKSWAGQTGLNGIQVLSDAFQSWIRKVEGESVGFVELIFGTNTEGRNLPLLLQRAKSITLSLLPVSDINRIAQGYGLPGRKTGDVSRSEYVIST